MERIEQSPQRLEELRALGKCRGLLISTVGLSALLVGSVAGEAPAVFLLVVCTGGSVATFIEVRMPTEHYARDRWVQSRSFLRRADLAVCFTVYLVLNQTPFFRKRKTQHGERTEVHEIIDDD